MDGLEIMFDGINLQEAGELLLDEPKSTRGIRYLCWKSYYRSLKDFSFAAIFGAKIITTKELPMVKEGLPGEHLLGSQYFGQKHDRRAPKSGDSTSNWEDLLKDESGEDFKAVGSLITSLDQVDANDLVFWREVVIRDVFLYLTSDKGPDPSLRKAAAGPEYLYHGRGNFPRFPQLQAMVPPWYSGEVLRNLRRNSKALPGVAEAHNDAIHEFICRNVVAHIGIYRWYSKVGEEALNKAQALRIPHASRQALPSVERLLCETNVEPALWQIRDLVVLGLLERMITESKSREHLLHNLVAASQDTVYDALREKIATALNLWKLMGYRAELDKIREDIEAEIYARKISANQAAVASGEDEAAYKKAIRALVRRGAGPEEITPDCRRVFREEFAHAEIIASSWI